MTVSATDIEATIQALTSKAGRLRSPVKRGADESGRWWVLLCGEPFCQQPFPMREKTREQLRAEALQHGIRLKDHIWVWDETGCAQLVVATADRRDKAQALAAQLRRRGLSVRIVQEWDTE